MSDSTAACLAGEWTIHAIAQHREAMLVLVNDGNVVFDASGITDMDTAGLQLLLSAQVSLAKRGQELRLQNASAAVKGLLQAYGLDMTLQSMSNEEAAA